MPQIISRAFLTGALTPVYSLEPNEEAVPIISVGNELGIFELTEPDTPEVSSVCDVGREELPSIAPKPQDVDRWIIKL